MFDEHFERSVDEVLYGVSLLQLGERVQKTCRVVTPVTFSEFIGSLFTPITIKCSMLSKILHSSSSNEDPECSICDSCYCHSINSTKSKDLNTQFNTSSYRSLLCEGFLLNLLEISLEH